MATPPPNPFSNVSPGRRTAVPLLQDARGTVTAELCDLTDVYRTQGGHKASLSEVYRNVFGRSLVAHDAGDDALMTMELYKHWVGMGRPAGIVVPLSFYVVNAHSFNPPTERHSLLWKVRELGVRCLGRSRLQPLTDQKNHPSR